MAAVLEPAQVGAQGPQGVPGLDGSDGDPGPQGPPGANEGFYHHVQNLAATTWHVNHMLNRHPLVGVVDSGGTDVEGTVTHIDQDNLDINFAVAFSGTADLT